MEKIKFITLGTENPNLGTLYIGGFTCPDLKIYGNVKIGGIGNNTKIMATGSIMYEHRFDNNDDDISNTVVPNAKLTMDECDIVILSGRVRIMCNIMKENDSFGYGLSTDVGTIFDAKTNVIFNRYFVSTDCEDEDGIWY